MPLVSIIVPNYNHELFLEERLLSIVNQTFQDFEIILLDDASTDKSDQILKHYSKNSRVSHFHINSENSGSPFRQWQKGIELAQGDYIWIAESDDYADATFLEAAINKLNLGVTICYTQSQDVDEYGTILSNRVEYTNEFSSNIWKKDFTIVGNTFIEKYLVEKNVIPNASAVVFRKSLIKDAFFSEELLNMKMCGDWFFWIQLSENATVSFISKPLNYFRIHKGVSRKQKDIEKQKLRVLEEAVCRNYLSQKYHAVNTEKNKALVAKWCKLHSKWAPFKKTFYQIKLSNISSIYLLLRFVSVKLTSK